MDQQTGFPLPSLRGNHMSERASIAAYVRCCGVVALCNGSWSILAFPFSGNKTPFVATRPPVRGGAMHFVEQRTWR